MGSIDGKIHRRTLLLQAGRLTAGLAVFLAGCGAEGPLPTVGQRVERNGIALTVDGVTRFRVFQVGDVIMSPGKDRTYLVIRITLGNVAHGQHTYRTEEFRVLAANGQEYEPKSSAMTEVSPIGSGSIERGGQRITSGTFAVPIDATGVVLRHRPSVGGEIRIALPSPAELEERSSIKAPPPGWPYTRTPTPSPPPAVSPTIPPTPTRVPR